MIKRTRQHRVSFLTVVLLLGGLYALFWIVNAKLEEQRTSKHSSPLPPLVRTQEVQAAVDVMKYTQSPYNLPSPNGEPDGDFNYNEQVAQNLNTLGAAVQANQTYLTSRFDAKYVDPFLSVIWIGAIENTGANPYFWNCQDSSFDINAGCAGGFYSGGWQVGYGMQVSQAVDHLASDFEAAYGGADDANKVQQIGQKVISDSGGKITNPSSFPKKTISTLVSEAKAGNTASQQAIAILLLDSKIGAITVALEVAGDIASRDNWRAAMEGWGSYYSSNMQKFSNRMKKIAEGYTGVAGSSNGTTGAGGGSFSLDLVLRPKENDSYVINKATAQAIGGTGGSGTGSIGIPPGSANAECTPTGTYPSDPAQELGDKYNISLSGFSVTGEKNIYDAITCLSLAKFSSYLPKSGTTIHNAISPSLNTIGMDCGSICNIWIPEGTSAFKFILMHEFGHVIFYSNPRETMRFTEFENAFSKEGGLSPYSGGGNGCSGGGIYEDYAELVAFYYNPQTGGKTGACDNRVDPPNSLFGTDKFPLHLEVAKQVL